VLFLHVTTRIQGAKYDDLLTEKGGTGFPHLAFLDASGEVIAEHNGPRTVPAFRKMLAKAKRIVELRAKAAAGDKAARIDLLILETSLGKRELADLKDLLEEEGLEPDEAQKAALLGLETDESVREIAEDFQRAKDDRTRARVRQELVAVFRGGGRPHGDMEQEYFWALLLMEGVESGDRELLRAAIEGAKPLAAESPNVANALSNAEKKLGELEKSGS